MNMFWELTKSQKLYTLVHTPYGYTWSHGAKSQGMICLLCLLAFVTNFNFQGGQVYTFLFFILKFHIYVYIILKKLNKNSAQS